jgi:ADP-ribosylglycohydrolase
MSGKQGTSEQPLNNSKGCGGIMRAAPVGLADVNDPFGLGCETGALTHGHPSGYLAAGVLALIIHELIRGSSLDEAFDAALSALRGRPDSQECAAALEMAIALACEGSPSPEMVERLGRGFVADEALAIAVYCALAAQGDFVAGVRLAVNHGGDSDSTGAITGNILGAMLGVDAIPDHWLERLELREEIAMIADDLLKGYDESEAWRGRYPPG